MDILEKTADDDFFCEHEEIEYDPDDDAVRGTCVRCGMTCDWSWETDYADGMEIKERVPTEWHEEGLF